MKLQKLVVLSMALVLLAASAAVAADKYVRKVDNFIFLVDTSGSMDDKYVDSKETKISLAKSILERINKMLPELGYNGGLNTAAPAMELKAVEPYQAAAYGAAIANIPTVIGSRPTPLGVGLASLEPALKNMVGRNAVIIVSDGQENQGIETLAVASELSEKYGVCFHTIGFADSVNGNQELLDKLTALKSCGVSTSAAQVADDAALENFVRAVFYDVAPVEIDPCSLDDDNDGIGNCQDKCADTPNDLVVDADGCPIPVVVKLKVNFDYDKADVKPQYHQELADFAEFMKQYPGVFVEIDGHTDSDGSDAYNQKLSLRRANSVRTYLIQKLGMDSTQLTAIGFGESKPVASNATDAGKAENRRIEAVLKGVFKKK
ncbi:MAG: VWA domain-containing protein [Deltaproteobacteria bacterium]|nr:VWA domain-containing protein [Deltaproteobacteria bacterium]